MHQPSRAPSGPNRSRPDRDRTDRARFSIAPGTSSKPLSGRIGLIALLAVASLIAVGCGTTSPTPSAATLTPSGSTGIESASPSPSEASSPSATSSGSATSSPAPSSQTQTAWGRIWDTVPKSLPAFPGAAPAQIGAGPFSATLSVQSSSVETVTAWYKASLDRLGYSTVVEPPLEDGTRILDLTGPPSGCRIQIRVAKQGVVTAISILYGAGCPLR